MVGGGWTGLPPRCPQSSPRARPQGHHCPQMGKPRPRPQSQGQRGDGATPVLSHPPLPRPDTPRQPRPRPGQGAPPSRHPPALRGRGNRDLEGECRVSGLRNGAAGRRVGAHPRSPVLETTGPLGLQGSDGSSWRPPRPSLSSTLIYRLFTCSAPCCPVRPPLGP